MFDWITGLLEQGGYFATAFLMWFENIFPPVPSELVMPLAGFLVYQGKLTLIGVLLAGTFGSLLGTWLWYLAARKFGQERLRRLVEKHGRWLTISTDNLDRASDWFERHGRMAILLGRMVPGVRTLISVPAGLTGMKTAPFLLYSLIGTLIWNSGLTGLGYLLGSQYTRVAQWLNPVTNVLLAALVLIYLYRLVTHKGAEKSG
ncbi:DedA family protein [Sulfitobacter aestuarii]|uniref:DedA family protein n=1 Tax=Sulfitobacter aestuarii TaxID=2161676 RepID=A0ABW5U1I5_9RHOB